MRQRDLVERAHEPDLGIVALLGELRNRAAEVAGLFRQEVDGLRIERRISELRPERLQPRAEVDEEVGQAAALRRGGPCGTAPRPPTALLSRT